MRTRISRLSLDRIASSAPEIVLGPFRCGRRQPLLAVSRKPKGSAAGLFFTFTFTFFFFFVLFFLCSSSDEGRFLLWPFGNNRPQVACRIDALHSIVCAEADSQPLERARPVFSEFHLRAGWWTCASMQGQQHMRPYC